MPEENTQARDETSPRTIDPAKWDKIAKQASHDAQAELHRQGLPYYIGRDGLVIEVLPTGEERIMPPLPPPDPNLPPYDYECEWDEV